jgi:hypothetical protein
MIRIFFCLDQLTKETSLKGKAQYSPCTNKCRSAPFYMDNIHICYETSYLK